MPRWRNKKILLLILCLVVSLLIIIPLSLILTRESEADKLANEINSIAGNYPAYINGAQVKESSEIFKNKKLSSAQRYTALENIVYYFSVGYATSHNPDIRAYANSLKDPAKKNFPREYREEYFIINCADSSCGEKPDEKLKQIQKEISESGIPSDYLDGITTNLEQASYLPKDAVDKEYGFKLVLHQLDEQNNPKASAAAIHLKDYLKKKYSFEFTQPSQ